MDTKKVKAMLAKWEQRYADLEKHRSHDMRQWLRFMLDGRKTAAALSPAGIERQGDLWREYKSGFENDVRSLAPQSSSAFARVQLINHYNHAHSEARFWYRYLRFHFRFDAISGTPTARAAHWEPTFTTPQAEREWNLRWIYAGSLWAVHSREWALLDTLLEMVFKAGYSPTEAAVEANIGINEIYKTVTPLVWSAALEAADGKETSIELLSGYVFAEAEVRPSLRRELAREFSGPWKKSLLGELPAVVASHQAILTPETITEFPGKVMYQLDKDLRLEFDQQRIANSRSKQIDPADFDNAADPHNPLRAFEDRAEIEAIIQRANLVGMEKTVFKLMFEQELTDKETARRLQRSPGTVHSWKARVKKKLERAIKSP